MPTKPPTKMILVVTKWVRREGSKEISRRIVEVKKVNRWLEARHMTFDPRTLRQTKACSTGSSYRYRLEPLPKDACPISD